MKAFFCISAIALALLLTVSEAFIGEQPSEIDSAHPGQCVWTNEGSTVRNFHAVDSSWKSGACEQATCIRKGGKLIVKIVGCPLTGRPPPCRNLPIDPSKPYPQCCSRAVCPKN